MLSPSPNSKPPGQSSWEYSSGFAAWPEGNISCFFFCTVSGTETSHACQAHYTVTEQCPILLKQENQMGFKLGSKRNPLFCLQKKKYTAVFGISTIQVLYHKHQSERHKKKYKRNCSLDVNVFVNRKRPAMVRVNRLPAMAICPTGKTSTTQQGSASSNVQQHQGTRPYYSQLSHQFVVHRSLWTLRHEYDSLLACGGLVSAQPHALLLAHVGTHKEGFQLPFALHTDESSTLAGVAQLVQHNGCFFCYLERDRMHSCSKKKWTKFILRWMVRLNTHQGPKL